MNMTKEMLREEYVRNLNMQKIYVREIEVLPRGSVVIKRSGNKDYCYLQYRDKDRIISKYIGHAETFADRLRTEVAERRELQQVLRRLKQEAKYLEKALRLND
jgi:hypothetical protein